MEPITPHSPRTQTAAAHRACRHDRSDFTIGSLCSGIGGLDLGVQAALGGTLAWHAEKDPRAAQILTRHWPGVPNHGDLTTTDWRSIEPVCVLTAGFPCQDLSIAGPRTGLTGGSRSGVWHHITRAIQALNPCMVVIENVRGLLSTRAGIPPVRHLEPCPCRMGDPPQTPRMRALGAVLGDLANLGLDASWLLLRASDVGAPHRRERVFLTAWPAPVAEDANLQPRCQWRLPAPRQTQGWRTRPNPGRRDRTPAAHPQSQRRCQRLPEPAPRQRQPHPRLHRCAHRPSTRDWGPYEPAIRRWEKATRPAPDPVNQRQRLTAEFVEWMMGYPRGWTTHSDLSRAAQLHLLGNAVVPQQATWALKALLRDDGEVQ